MPRSGLRRTAACHRRYGLANCHPAARRAGGTSGPECASTSSGTILRGDRRGGPVPRPVVDRRDRIRAVARRPERGARRDTWPAMRSWATATGAGTTSGCVGSGCRPPRTGRRSPARGGTRLPRPGPARPARRQGDPGRLVGFATPAHGERGLALGETEAELALAAAERTRIARLVRRRAMGGRPRPLGVARQRLPRRVRGLPARRGRDDHRRPDGRGRGTPRGACHRDASRRAAARPRGRGTRNAGADRPRAPSRPRPSRRPGAERPVRPDKRERDVLPLIVQGRTNRQIAETLFISENTAGVHVSNILGKLGASTRTEAAAVATRLG